MKLACFSVDDSPAQDRTKLRGFYNMLLTLRHLSRNAGEISYMDRLQITLQSSQSPIKYLERVAHTACQ